MVRALINDHGAELIKLPVTAELGTDHQLSAAALAAAVAEAHALGVKVVSHATSVGFSAAAATAGVDMLAHLPGWTVEPSLVNIRMWRNRAVVPTSGVFSTGQQLAGWHAAMAELNITILCKRLAIDATTATS